jgi:hypothetical protein
MYFPIRCTSSESPTNDKTPTAIEYHPYKVWCINKNILKFEFLKAYTMEFHSSSLEWQN